MSEDMYMTTEILDAFITYVLVLLRTGCLMLFAPFFSSEVFFSQLRICLALTLPLLLVPFAMATARPPSDLDMQGLFLLAGQEFALGMAIAYMGSMIFTGVQMAGEISGQQIGFSMANVMDPQSGIEVPMLGFINMNLTIMMFITAKLHLVLIYIMAKSYDCVPIGTMLTTMNFAEPVYEMSMLQAAELVKLGARMAIPVMMIMLMNSIVEGFITKTMPQMNIQVLGMPLRVVLGLSTLIFVYPAICMSLVPYDWTFNLHQMPDGPFGEMLQELGGMVETMGRNTPVP